MRKDLHEQNRIAWNEATRAHNSHKRDQARFFREGGSTLFPEEIELLGDVRRRRVVHLQCNAGQDTLSLARLGAVVTGVDISDEAIAFARRLSEASGIPAEFVRADVYDWFEETARRGRRFDTAFSSYGFLYWLSDLGAWARGLASVLEPGGRFACVEFHPFAGMLDGSWQVAYDYFGGEPLTFETGIGDYVAESGDALAPMGFEQGVQNFRNPHPSHEFAWTVADLLTALIEAGFDIRTVREYPYANGCRLFPDLRRLPGNRWAAPEDRPEAPLMLGLAATLRG